VQVPCRRHDVESPHRFLENQHGLAEVGGHAPLRYPGSAGQGAHYYLRFLVQRDEVVEKAVMLVCDVGWFEPFTDEPHGGARHIEVHAPLPEARSV